MKISVCFCMLVVFLAVSHGKRPVTLIPDKAYVYRTPEAQSVKDSITIGQPVYLLKEGAAYSKVKTSRGSVGWVRNSEIQYQKVDKVDIYQLENQDVLGWLDNPHAIYILDENDFETSILLTRTFTNEIFEFIDRETMERSNDEN